MRKNNFALRLQPSLLEEARQIAEAEGVALNQLINVAVAEKLSALRTEKYLAERGTRSKIPKALELDPVTHDLSRTSRTLLLCLRRPL
jgi:hypothetical protein